MDAQLIVHDRQGIASHPARTDSVKARSCRRATIRCDVGVGLNIRSRQNLFAEWKTAQSREAGDLSCETNTANRGFDIDIRCEVVGIDCGECHRIRRNGADSSRHGSGTQIELEVDRTGGKRSLKMGDELEVGISYVWARTNDSAGLTAIRCQYTPATEAIVDSSRNPMDRARRGTSMGFVHYWNPQVIEQIASH